MTNTSPTFAAKLSVLPDFLIWVLSELCGNIFFILCGIDEKNLNVTRTPVYTTHCPAGTSVQNMVHWAQAVHKGKLMAFDFGAAGNMKHYNQSTPPEYHVQDMKRFPALCFQGDRIRWRTPKMWLSSSLRCPIWSSIRRLNTGIIWILSGSEIIRRWGTLQREHEVPDGGQVHPDRQQGSHRDSDICRSKPAVFLQQHSGTPGNNWITNLPELSHGCVLARRPGLTCGWETAEKHLVGNTRPSKPDQDFWRFSHDEMALKDTGYLWLHLKVTGQEQIYYIGLSERPIGGVCEAGLLPQVTHDQSGSLNCDIIRLGTPVCTPCWDLQSEHGPWAQALRGGRLMAFDFGAAGNMKHYNQSTPPEYHVQDMKVPTALFSGGQDTLADPKDAAVLLTQVPNLVFHQEIKHWDHLDFIWGLDAPEQMFPSILKLLQEHR
ncbi:lysosomal acid lipase/cholesteryl ester hydrolase-like protein [Lates japonicus]|uniref:Lysosomal acid lipase/cholesteryl ester hydrolase-like protein n=1 Tax=Lates japonicus TaxID=270547 RepID=A0AAD3NC78_LATJO|nr:lysosomal acid lipase/cholesteryl ester hydrolase-like protein [Lates japonicus]